MDEEKIIGRRLQLAILNLQMIWDYVINFSTCMLAVSFSLLIYYLATGNFFGYILGNGIIGGIVLSLLYLQKFRRKMIQKLTEEFCSTQVKVKMLLICPSCGSEVDINSGIKFCPKCNYRLVAN